MLIRLRHALALGVLTGVCLPAALAAQTPSAAPCAATPIAIPLPKPAPPLSEAQESDLGDAIAEHYEQFYRVLDDDAAARLQAIGNRLIGQLPPTNYRFRFLLVNLGEANAFAAPGGRIYVSRKLVVSTRNEDELAGVLAHEIGHVVTRQLAVSMSRRFRESIQVTSFGDRRDVFEKYARLVESTRRVREGRDEEDEQQEADRVALLIASRAGYAPGALIDWFDRIAATERRTGNFFTDLFGATRPESRRLREQLRTLATLPQACRTAAPPASDESFEAWRRRVVAAAGRSPAESLRAVVADMTLEPPLSDGLTHLRFSPDGRYAIAQSESTIHVLTREPFAVVFSIDADAAGAAGFTPDSTQVIFSTSDLRVERWDLATRARSAVHEIASDSTCIALSLSPDGSLLGCLDDGLAVRLFDVAKEAEVFRKERAYQINWMLVLLNDGAALQASLFQLAFSPDGAYFIVGHASGETVVDVKTRAEVKLPGPTRAALRQNFAFLDAGRLVTADPRKPEASAILRFPSGELVRTVLLSGRLTAVTRGEAVIARPIRDWALGVVDLTSGRIITASRRDAFDAFDEVRLTEQPNGDVALYAGSAQRASAVASLPRTRLGRLRASDVSPDLKWLALSGGERGAMWDVGTGARVAHVRGFQGASVADEGFVADFPKQSQVLDGKPVERPRSIVRFDRASSQTFEESVVKDESGRQVGRFFLVRTPAKAEDPLRDVTLDVRDVRTGATLWSRRFEGAAPAQYPDIASGRLVLEHSVTSPTARRAIEQDVTLRGQVAADKLKGGDAYLEVLELATGKAVGRLLVNTGRDSLRIRHVATSGDAVTIAVRNNQVFVHSLSSGARRGRAFGQYAAPSDAAGLVCIQNESTEVDCYDAATMEHRAEIRLAASVRVLRFSDDGRRLLIVTSDQVAKIFDTAALRAPVP